MNRGWLAVIPGLLILAACSDSSAPSQPDKAVTPRADAGVGSGSRVHIMSLRGMPSGSSGIQTSGALSTGISYHGGPILPQTKVVALYWAATPVYLNGPAAGTTGTGTQDNSTVGFFLRHLGGSPYFNINTTYFDQINGGHTVQNVVTYTGYWADNQNVPASNGSTVTDATMQAEIVRGFTTGVLTYDPATVYAIFTKGNTNLGGGFGSQYCAYHSNFTWNGKLVIYAAMPYAFQYPSGCTNGTASPNADPGADAVINVLAHEIEESTTDYALNAWFDGFGQENADKCAWTFGTTYNNGTGVANMNLGGKDFLVQQNWLNSGSGGCFKSFSGTTNKPPVARFTWTCNTSHLCTFDGTTSSDPDGTIVAYAWRRGTLTTVIGTASKLTLQFSKTTTAKIKLTVTDNGGLTNTVVHSIPVP